MNLYRNAKPCPKSRVLMVHRVARQERPVAQVAGEIGVSPRTMYKWVQRFCDVGAGALEDGSSRRGVVTPPT